MSPFATPILRRFFLWMIVGMIITMLLLAFATGGFVGIQSSHAVIVTQLLAILPLTWLLWRNFRGDLSLQYFFRSDIAPFSKSNLFVIWISLVILSVGIEGITHIVFASFAPSYIEDVLSEQIIDPSLTPIFNVCTVFLATILGPLMEEFVFRGLLLQRLSVKYNKGIAILSSSFLFGILHFESWLSATIFGILMCLVFFRSNNLWIPIAMHVLNNIVAVLINLMQHHALKMETISQLEEYLWFYLAALLAAPILYKMVTQMWGAIGDDIPYDNNLNLAS